MKHQAKWETFQNAMSYKKPAANKILIVYQKDWYACPSLWLIPMKSAYISESQLGWKFAKKQFQRVCWQKELWTGQTTVNI